MLDRKAMAHAFDEAEKAFGTVTILVNNAGVAHSTRAVELTEEEWRRVVGTNLDAVFFWAQEAARRMLAAKKPGAIVNIASVLGLRRVEGNGGLRGRQGGRDAAHQDARPRTRLQGHPRQRDRAGLDRDRLNRDFLLSEHGAAIKREIPVGRFGEERDLDGALLLLASDAGRFIAGTTIVVDGGQLVAIRG